MIAFGCRPSEGVAAQTTMIANVSYILDSLYDRFTQAVEFPTCFDSMKSDDANIEIVSSSSLQTMRLVRKHNVVTHTIAAIFVTPELKGMEYQGWESRVNKQKEIFGKYLQYDEVKVHKDLSKDEYIA